MLNSWKSLAALTVTACLIAGCGKSSPGEKTAKSPTSSTSTTPDSSYLLADKPADAQGVGAAREKVKDAEDVTLVGRIGGSHKPFVDGIAAFTIVDPNVAHCAADEGCPTPWDYCCTQDQVKDNIASVRVVDAAGKPVSQGAKDLLGVKELDTVIVRGKAQRDDAGNLVVLADKVYIDKQ